jgi:ankyrin repeat protein
LNSFPDGCCFASAVIVTSAGVVVSLSEGRALKQLAFPQREYPDPRVKVHEPLLHFAARFGTLKTIESLIADGSDVNVTDDSGSTPLHIAAMKGRSDVVKRLLEFGADTGKRNDSGETAAEAAGRVGQSDVLRILLGS